MAVIVKHEIVVKITKLTHYVTNESTQNRHNVTYIVTQKYVCEAELEDILHVFQ